MRLARQMRMPVSQTRLQGKLQAHSSGAWRGRMEPHLPGCLRMPAWDSGSGRTKNPGTASWQAGMEILIMICQCFRSSFRYV